MAGLIVVGSIVRTTGSGLACPDWPLCEGRVIPRLEYHVLLEWGHRLLALCVSLGVFATGAWVAGHRAVRARIGGLLLLAGALLVTQVLLGALTIWKLLSPAVVSSHLATALLLFATLLTAGLVARRAAGATAPAAPSAGAPNDLLALFAGATLLTWAQAVLGGVVSTTGAGVACPDWPTCRGAWLPPLDGLVAVQMAHRWTAYTLAALLAVLALRARRARDPRVARAGAALAALVVLQMAVGVLNVLLGIRVWVSALHLATATAMLAIAVTTTHRLAAARAPRRAPAAPRERVEVTA